MAIVEIFFVGLSGIPQYTWAVYFLNSSVSRWTQTVSISGLAYALHEGQHRDLATLPVHVPSSESHSSFLS